MRRQTWPPSPAHSFAAAVSIVVAFASVGLAAWVVTWMEPAEALPTVAGALLVAGFAVWLARRLRRSGVNRTEEGSWLY